MRNGIQLVDAAAADGFELQITRIQIAADARLADLHAVVRSAGHMTAQAKIRAHGGGHAVLGQGQLARCAIKAHRHRTAVGQGGRAAAIYRVAAANGNIQPRWRAQRGQIHAHRAIHGGILRQSGRADKAAGQQQADCQDNRQSGLKDLVHAHAMPPSRSRNTFVIICSISQDERLVYLFFLPARRPRPSRAMGCSKA